MRTLPQRIIQKQIKEKKCRDIKEFLGEMDWARGKKKPKVNVSEMNGIDLARGKESKDCRNEE